jgi:perosamine synthetase
MALGIGSGDEVIVPALTYVATANAVTYTGATPVLADSETNTWNIDPKSVEAQITPKTKAIIAVHLYGHPADMDALAAIAGKHGLRLIEDSAESLGSEYKGKKCGALSDVSTFSFYGNKTVTTGEGGMVATNDERLARRVALLKGQGMDPARRYWFVEVGYNYRMTNVAAAMGLAQMERIGEFVEKRRIVARWYAERLSGVRGIKLQTEESWARSACWLYSVLIEDGFGMTRDALMEALEKNGVETRPFFYPMHVMPVYVGKNRVRLPNAERISTSGINLPTFSGITEAEVDRVAGLVKSLQANP